MLTQSPACSFLIASSIAGWKIPPPRTVSITWPRVKNLENILPGVRPTCDFSNLEGIIARKYMGGTHGLVNMISLAEPDQNVVRVKGSEKSTRARLYEQNAIDVEKCNISKKQAECNPTHQP
jgi:hypothetical protein